MRTVSSGLMFNLVLSHYCSFHLFLLLAFWQCQLPSLQTRVGTGPKEQLFVMMAQLGSCNSSQSLLSCVLLSSLCPATPEFDGWAACGLKSPSTTKCKLMLVQRGTTSLGQK